MRPRATRWARSSVLLLALGHIVNTVVADSCAPGSIFTITTQEDAATVAKCRDYRGDIAISPSATFNITLGGLVNLDGSLFSQSGDGPGPVGLYGDNLATITGRLAVSSLSSLTAISFPALKTISGPIAMTSLASLSTLNLRALMSAGSINLQTLPSLRLPRVHTTSSSSDDWDALAITNGTITIRDAAIETISNIITRPNCTLVELSDLPNLAEALLLVARVDVIRVRGNGNLTLYMPERMWSGYPDPVIGRLDISGVGHVSPCLWPEVHEFVAVNNTVEYLHFGFRRLRMLEIRGNQRLRQVIPWLMSRSPFSGGWDVKRMVIRDNPLLKLQERAPRMKNDTLTEASCPFMFGKENDKWEWQPWRMDELVVHAEIDKGFFNGFTNPWFNSTFSREDRGRALLRFEVNSTDPAFSCEQLDEMRSKKGAFPGEYICQGKTLPAGGVESPGSNGAVSTRGEGALLMMVMVMAMAAAVSGYASGTFV